jgi:hypothetical protein
MRWVLVSLIVGCGPAVVLDDADEGGTSTSSPPSGSTGGEEEGPPGMPDRTTSGRGSDESSGGDSSSTGEPIPESNACPELHPESVRCLFLSTAGVSMVGMDTGTTCTVLSPIRLDASSLVWRGDELFLCNYDGNSRAPLTRVDLVTGETTESDVPCQAVAEYEGGFLVLGSPANPLRYYASFDDVLAQSVTAEIEVEPFASRITTRSERLYGAWHSTNFLEVWDVPTATLVEELPLQGHDDWVMGLSVVDARLFLLARDEMIVEFDVSTGDRVAELPLAGYTRTTGLACRAAG